MPPSEATRRAADLRGRSQSVSEGELSLFGDGAEPDEAPAVEPGATELDAAKPLEDASPGAEPSAVEASDAEPPQPATTEHAVAPPARKVTAASAVGRRRDSAPAQSAVDDNPAQAPSPPTGQGTDSAGAEGPRVWRVSQVNKAVRRMLEGTLESLWISGEIANWKRVRSGHCYFTLKDESAQIRSVLFRQDAERLPIDPEDGMEVRVFGSLTLYEARGEYQFVGRKIEAEGSEGLWRAAFDKLKAKLDAEGLTAPGRKRPLPRYPMTVGVVTSTTGAALRDIISVLGRRAPWVRVLVAGSRVQGDGAALEIANAIRTLADTGEADVMIVGRGGGSIEDLWAFNEEVVARAIAACPIPVISAVGHEVDVTIADLVADLRAPTPSAAGEAAVPDAEALAEVLAVLRPRMRRAVRNAVESRTRAISEGPDRLARALSRKLQPVVERLRRDQDRATLAIERAIEGRATRGDVLPRLERGMRGRMETARRDLRSAAGRLDALSPLATLKRGYAVPLTPDGRVLRSINEFEAGQAFDLRVSDGQVRCETTETQEGKESP